MSVSSRKNVNKTKLSKLYGRRVGRFFSKIVPSSEGTHDGITEDQQSNSVVSRTVKRIKKKFGATLQDGKTPVQKQPTDKSNRKVPRPRVRKHKAKKKNKEVQETEEDNAAPVTRYSDDPMPKKVKWINRQRVLLFGSRGISKRHRHLMKDLLKMLPHSKPENKMERHNDLTVVNEMCEMKHCNKCMLFEGCANRDVYLWLSSIPNGPSVKFHLQNIYTMDELSFTGNCLIGSRPLLSFDENFEKSAHFLFIKELLIQIFGTPNHHPKSQPFFDHVFTFSIVDNRVWFRNYQILSEDGAVAEIGPRFVMNPVKIFSGSFGGAAIWENPHYISPAKKRILLKNANSSKYLDRYNKKVTQQNKEPTSSYKLPALDEVFTNNTWEKARELATKQSEGSEISSNPKKRKRKQKNPNQEKKTFKKSKKK